METIWLVQDSRRTPSNDVCVFAASNGFPVLFPAVHGLMRIDASCEIIFAANRTECASTPLPRDAIVENYTAYRKLAKEFEAISYCAQLDENEAVTGSRESLT
jgi:hypothetical protein